MSSIFSHKFFAVKCILVTGLIIVGAKLNLQIGSIPITLQVPVIVGSAVILGAEIGLLGTLLYILLGTFLPVFADNTCGVDVFTGNTVGFIVMFPVAAYIAGKLAYGSLNIRRITGALLLAQTIVMVGGVIGLMLAKHLSFSLAFEYGFTNLAIIGYSKMIVTALIVWMIKR